MLQNNRFLSRLLPRNDKAVRKEREKKGAAKPPPFSPAAHNFSCHSERSEESVSQLAALVIPIIIQTPALPRTWQLRFLAERRA